MPSHAGIRGQFVNKPLFIRAFPYLRKNKLRLYMAVHEINSNYIFTDGEVISLKIDYQAPVKSGQASSARVKIRAKHALPKEKFEYCLLELNFSKMISLYITEDFDENKRISNMTLKQLDDGTFYISLYPYNANNEPDERDNFVIKAKNFTFDLLKS